MKKYLPYIIIGVVILAALFLLLSESAVKQQSLDERFSFRKRDKIPYGTYAAFTSLKSFFPNASVSVNKQEPGYWDSLSEYGKDQALIIIAPKFEPDNYEMKNLISFIENGNSVFISTMDVSDDVTQILKCRINSSANLDYYFSNTDEFDTLTVSLGDPPFKGELSYTYPGKQFDSYFSGIDTSVTTVLGYDHKHRADFIQLKAGEGSMYLHLAPMTFSNYFLLHKNNFTYYERLLSFIPANAAKVVWDEYYLTKKNTEQKNRSNWLSVFLRHPALRWALITALLALLVFVLLEMRRKQRPIPVIAKPRNDSLDFVKTIGRLYHDKGDHKNLSRKMAAYFLEHVRNKYKLPTNELNDEFITNLKFKTGAEEAEIRSIVSFIRELDHVHAVSDNQLANFHKQLEKFYQYS